MHCTADLYGFAGVVAIEFLGGPRVPFNFGRTDDATGARCPANGRLPDALQGADHLRDLFGARMGFSDQEIVALSGAHTLGRCHAVRSGFDGPWTTHPLRFDNEYFVNLLNRTWKPRKWTGPLQVVLFPSSFVMSLPFSTLFCRFLFISSIISHSPPSFVVFCLLVVLFFLFRVRNRYCGPV